MKSNKQYLYCYYYFIKFKADLFKVFVTHFFLLFPTLDKCRKDLIVGYYEK